MKSVMISIQPKWCELIAVGEKTVEVRKTKPKIETPFKCYIYCTQGKTPGDILTFAEYKNGEYMGDYYANGKVIGEFVCERIQKYECEFVDDECYEEIASVLADEDGDETGFIEWSNDSGLPYEGIDLYSDSCVEYSELKKYMGVGFGTFYGWHISNLVIYEQPKGLSEFYTEDNSAIQSCEHRKTIGQPEYKTAHNGWIKGGYLCNKSGELTWCEKCKTKPLARPPQSWCYVVEKGGAE